MISYKLAVSTKKKKFTAEKYLALEETAKSKSEYVGGKVYQMAGGTEAHIQISFNVTRFLADKLRGKCRAYQSGMKVWVDTADTFFYPDVTVICGDRKFHKDRRDIVENPILLVEVLSEGTKVYDKNDKFLIYQNIESFKEYVLISQNQPAVQQFIKQDNGTWNYKATIGLESKVYFESVKTEITLKEIYDLVEFDF